jgi:hypothetical protein
MAESPSTAAAAPDDLAVQPDPAADFPLRQPGVSQEQARGVGRVRVRRDGVDSDVAVRRPRDQIVEAIGAPTAVPERLVNEPT